MVLLINIARWPNHAMCASLSNQKCMTQPNLIQLYPNECNQELHYYPLAVKSGKCI